MFVRRNAMLWGLAAATIATAGDAAPPRRGPVPVVIRRDLDAFPNHPRFEARGPVSLTTIAGSVWSSPPPSGPFEGPPRAASWDTPLFTDTWSRLRAEQYEAFTREPDRRPERKR